MNVKTWICVGALLALTSVVMGAFAAHALKATLSDYALNIIDTGARYQMYHALAIILVSLVSKQLNIRLYMTQACFTAGIVLFSGSLYLLAITELRWFAYITPIGGMLLILAWVSLIFSVLKANTHV
ncbi:DUF423 domain-containing protein [Agaribacter flavus]|uniref:DUF423 domain-containing protein n=1 Tax=Agaribacter flavus TaxID=1902781 RepID=A0ABV7FJG4_9ALTE